MIRTGLATLVALLLAPAVAPAATVNIQFQDFGPGQLDVLPGETVEWDNVSARTHTVTADSGAFDAGEVAPGAKFSYVFASEGLFPYHCTIHAGMVGEVDVRRVILGALPTAPVNAGDPVEFEGRTATPGEPVLVQRSIAGGEFRTIGTAAAAPDGTWSTAIPAQSTGDYRAASAAGVSGVRRMIVADRKILVRATSSGVSVSVSPPLPYARVALMQDLRERFGWWPALRTRLDYVSQASFKVARPARVRVVLVAKDGWTTLATSPVLQLGHARGRARSKPMVMHGHMR